MIQFFMVERSSNVCVMCVEYFTSFVLCLPRFPLIPYSIHVIGVSPFVVQPFGPIVLYIALYRVARVAVVYLFTGISM